MTWPRRLLPIILVQLFMWLTLLMYAYGPWQWPMRDPVRFYAFLFACHIAILVGYVGAAHRAPSPLLGNPSVERVIRTSLWVTLAILPVTCYARTGHWIPDIVGGLRDPGRAYSEAIAFQDSGAANFGGYVRIVAGPWLVALMPLAAFSWGHLSWPTRVLTLFVMLVVVLMSLATGKRGEIADMMLIVPFLLAASHWAGITRFSRRTIVTGIGFLTVAFVALTGFFVYSHVSRVGEDRATRGANAATYQLPDFNSPLLRVIPEGAQPGFLAVANYATTGYYGLSLAMDREVKPMWGMGHSMFLTRNVVKLANLPDFEKRSLPVQISDYDGFTYPVLWCTAYPYIANDVGWLGTILVMFVLGRLFALTWIDTLGGENYISIVLFSLLALIIFYLPASVRVLQDGDGVIAFDFWLVLWLFYRRGR